MKIQIVVAVGIALIVNACAVDSKPVENAGAIPQNDAKTFDEYWNKGEAEIASYTLKQARYGEVHEGTAVMVFVTEPFRVDKQVKSDNSNDPAAVPILKLNSLKKWTTGVYDYSAMTSVFSRTELDKAQHALKVTTTVQDWCGHAFSQINQRDGVYKLQYNSYFESEGDAKQDVPLTWLEDEVWTILRIDPSKLPTGDITMIPGSVYARLMHQPMTGIKAVAKMELPAKAGGESFYEINYPTKGRTVRIYFKNTFPYTIESWEEEYVSGWGSGASKLKTTATLKKRIMSDYWNHNSLADQSLRKELGL